MAYCHGVSACGVPSLLIAFPDFLSFAFSLRTSACIDYEGITNRQHTVLPSGHSQGAQSALSLKGNGLLALILDELCSYFQGPVGIFVKSKLGGWSVQ